MSYVTGVEPTIPPHGGTVYINPAQYGLTDGELSALIGMRPGEDQAAAIRRYVRETQDHYGSVVSRAEAAEQKLKRMRKLLKKALGSKR